MSRSKSVAETRRELPALLDDVERGDEVVITRRGKSIGVLVSYERYIAAQRHAFREILAKWIRDPPKHLDGTEFSGLRDRSSGRR